MIRRFKWKVVSLMLLVSALPSLAGVIIVDQLLKNSVSLGFNPRVGASLDRATITWRDHIELRKRAMGIQTRGLSHSAALPRLVSAARADSGAEDALAQWMERQSKVLSDGQQEVAMVQVRARDDAAPIQGDGDNADLDGDTARRLDGPWQMRVDRRGDYPRERWRAKTVRVPVEDADGRSYELAVTYVVPWALFEDFQELGKVQKLFDHLDDRQAALAQGSTRTFLLMTGVVLWLTFILGVLLAQATTRRLAFLAEGTARVAKGDLSVQVPVQGEDEIAQLAQDFNAMVVELRQTRARLAYLERVSAWQEIARRLAHEIKNPLTPILLAVQQLDRKFEDYHTRPERYRRLVSDAMEIVSEEVGALKTLVKEFSDFARLPEVQPTPAPLVAFVRDVLKTNLQFSPYLGDTPLEAPGLEDALAGLDGTMMRRALINLVANACEAVDGLEVDDTTGAVRVRVERLDDARLQVIVEDRGEGVAEAHAERLFEPYFTTKRTGTGLGLSIVKKIILDHGGDIRVESPAREGMAHGERDAEGFGPGARMVVVLPEVSADARSEGDGDDDAAP